MQSNNQSTTSQKFHLGDLLSISTGRLVSPTHMDGVYAILNFMTGDDLYTHQLPRARREARPYLMDQHPWLVEIEQPLAERISTLPEGLNGRPEHATALKAAIDDLLAPFVAKYGEWHDVEPMPMDDHDVIDPVEELHRMRPDIEPIVIDMTERGNEPNIYGDINWK